jgi:hypothetical protein
MTSAVRKSNKRCCVNEEDFKVLYRKTSPLTTPSIDCDPSWSHLICFCCTGEKKMDHLILPENPINPLIRVPVLSTVNYDGGDFETYPERQGWGPRAVVEWQTIFDSPPHSLRQFLQRWLYFGLVHAFFRFPSDTFTFVTRDHQDLPILTTASLPSLARQWKERFAQGWKWDEVYNLLTAIHKCMMIKECLGMKWKYRQQKEAILHQRESLYTFILTEQPSDPREPHTVIATTLFVEFLLGCLNYASSDCGGDQGSQSSLNSLVHIGDPLWQIMRQNGWCPSELMPMCQEFNTSGVLFLSNITRPNRWEEHKSICTISKTSSKNKETSQFEQSQSLCKVYECPFRQLSKDAYQRRHTDDCSGCVDVVADLDELSTILESGKIPLILSIDDGDENNDIVLIAAEEDMAYIAISHVWADGLGNVHRNALPRCWLLRLSNMTRNLPGNASNILLFWLDTICVPRGNAYQDEAQKIALQKMRQTYEDATAVLVLDSWLLSCEISRKSETETLMRIFNSPWNRRLWTFQEGALPKSLMFQFGDVACELDSMMKRLNVSEDLVMNCTLKSSLNARHQSLRGFRSASHSVEAKISTIIGAVKFRTTSVASDEALCLGALLGFDMSQIVATAADLRMEQMWRMAPSVPTDILFYQGDTMEKPGLRWAPRTLLLSQSNVNPSSGLYDTLSIGESFKELPPAKPTTRGLMVPLPGLIFSIDSNALGTSFLIKDEKGNSYHITTHIRKSPYTDVIQEDINGTVREGLSINPGRLYGASEVAFISRFRPLEITGMQLMLDKVCNEMDGILVAIVEEENGIIYAKKLCGALRSGLIPGTHDFNIQVMERLYSGQQPYGSPVGRDRRNGTLKTSIGKTTPAEQIWCVD